MEGTPMTVTAYSHPMRIALADEITDIDLAVLQGMWSVEQYLALKLLDGLTVRVDQIFDAR
jgi:hypothetical protein